jgi:hypothetical protein
MVINSRDASKDRDTSGSRTGVELGVGVIYFFTSQKIKAIRAMRDITTPKKIRITPVAGEESQTKE